MGSEPPLLDALKSLHHQLGDKNHHECSKSCSVHTSEINNDNMEEDFSLPLIDLNRLSLNSIEQEAGCKKEIANAAATYGFFHIINHGIPKRVLERLYHQQMMLFQQPFHLKSGNKFMNLPANSYRWGNPAAKSVGQFMWSEAFHIGASDISNVDAFNRSSFETFASGAANLSKRIAEILAENLGVVSSCTSLFNEKCSSDSCYLRLNRYPPCHISSEVFGFMPHTDSGFLTILLQDEVGGLQLVKQGRWYNVQPVPGALTVGIGDLFENNIALEAKVKWYMIVDSTCFVDSESRKALQLLQGLRGTKLIVPGTVLRELDAMNQHASLFRGKNKTSAALQWLEDCLVNTKWWIHVQSFFEEVRHLAPTPPASPKLHNSYHQTGIKSWKTLPIFRSFSEVPSPKAEDHILVGHYAMHVGSKAGRGENQVAV